MKPTALKKVARPQMEYSHKDDTSRKPFSKPAGPGQLNKQGSRLRSTPGDTKVGQQRTASTQPGSVAAAPPASTASEMFAEDEAAALKPAKVKKPKAPKPPVDPNEKISQRAFIGGLAKDVTPADVEGRFKSFGQLKDVHLAKDLDGTCRGFGYVTLDTTRKDWSKCVTLFNGAKWKGNVLKIEEANKDWQTKRQEDLEAQAKLEKKEQDAAFKKLKRNPIKHAEDMSLITDKNMDGKRGWKRGRFGRPVITMKLDRLTYDPSHYKNNAEKIYSTAGKPLPLDQLLYQIDEDEPLPKGKHLSTEVALAPFLSRSKPTVLAAAAADKATTPRAGGSNDTLTPKSTTDKINTSDDRTMMASILAGIDMSPRALSLDGSDIDGDEEGESYMEDFGVLQDTQADDLFGDVVLDTPAVIIPKAQRDTRSEDLFGDNEDDDAPQVDEFPLDFLEEDEDEEEEYEEDQDEEMESAGEDEDEVDEEDDEEEEDEDGIDEDTIEAITRLQGLSSASGGSLFDSDDDQDQGTKSASLQVKLAEESNTTRLKALEAREAELEAARDKQQQVIASTLANIDSRDKKAGHVVFSDSDDYDSEDYEQMEADHAKKQTNMSKPPKSIFDSDSGSDEEEQASSIAGKKRKGVKEMFTSDDETDDARFAAFGEPGLNIKEQFEGPGGKALFQMQSKIGTSDSRFQLTKDFLDDRIRAEDDVDYVAHQDRLKAEEFAASGAAATGIVLDEDRQAESNISAEKMQAMNVLRAMFGDSAVRSKKKEEDTARQAKGGLGYTTGLTVRYDPDAAPPPPPPKQPEPTAQEPRASASDSSESEQPSKDSSDVEEEEEEEEEEEQDEDAELEDELAIDDKAEEKDDQVQEAKPAKNSVGFSFAFDADELNNDGDNQDSSEFSGSAAPKKDFDNTRKFQVATDLKSLFAPTAGTFKLFGGDDEEEDEENELLSGDVEDDRQAGFMNDDRSQDEILTSYTEGSRTIFASGAEALTRAPLSHTGSMFFFHFNNPALLKRSNFKTTNKVFMRTGTMDEVTAHWEKTRHTMTQEFKRKHKSASRNKARASKRFKTGAGGRSHGAGNLMDQS
ncbi:nucleolar protein 8 [Gamsiella multidivaricata]|nr:nucleolar protein 8 [Gamsiella multidivaricata]